jgi:hypothetical protein
MTLSSQAAWSLNDEILDACVEQSDQSAVVAASDAAARDRCHILIEQLPSDGLGEAEESLSMMCEHYSTVEAKQIPTPVAVVAGRVVGEYVRPVFPVTEDEE